MKSTAVYIEIIRIKQLCSNKLRDFAVAFRVRKLFGTFKKRAPDLFSGFFIVLFCNRQMTATLKSENDGKSPEIVKHGMVERWNGGTSPKILKHGMTENRSKS